MKSDIDKILDLIMSKKLSLRKAEEKYGYSREFLKEQLLQKYKNNPQMLLEIDEVMNYYKSNSSTKSINEEVLIDVFLETMSGNLSLEDAMKRLNIKDRATLKDKFQALISNTENEEVRKKYKEYKEVKDSCDYSTINFRVVAIEMIKGNYSQLQMAQILEIPPRTVSREFEKFKNDEDTAFFDIIKYYSDIKMKHKKMTNKEYIKIMSFIEKYEMDNQELLETEVKSKTQLQQEKDSYLVSRKEELLKQGLTMKQIADELGTSISFLRRAQIRINNSDKSKNILDEK